MFFEYFFLNPKSREEEVIKYMQEFTEELSNPAINFSLEDLEHFERALGEKALDSFQ